MQMSTISPSSSAPFKTLKTSPAKKSPISSLQNPNPFKLRLSSAASSPLLGLSLLSSSPPLADIASFSGYDFLLLSSPSLLPLPIPYFLRLDDPSRALARAADALLLPFSERASASLFPSAAVAVEATSLDQIYHITDTDGVDAVCVSKMEFAAGMGMLWAPRSGKVRERVAEAERRVLEKGKVLMGSATEWDPAEGMKARGYGVVVGSTDVEMFRRAAVADVTRWRNAGRKEESEEEEVEDEAYWKIM